MKKLNVHQNKIKLEFHGMRFCKYHQPTRRIKQKVANFAPSIKSIMANKLPSNNLERFLKRIKSPLTR